MNKPEDVRITKSKRDLRNALSELMKTKPFKKITVDDICAAAMINRMTFYKHYDDKYDLLNDILIEIKLTVINRVKAQNTSADKSESDVNLVFILLDAVIDECLENKQLLLMASGDDMLITMISTVIEKSIYELLCELNKRQPFKYRLDMLAAAVMGATTFLIRFWVIHEQTDNKEMFLKKTKEFLLDLFNSKILFKD